MAASCLRIAVASLAWRWSDPDVEGLLAIVLGVVGMALTSLTKGLQSGINDVSEITNSAPWTKEAPVRRSIICAIAVLLAASWAGADTGAFSSFSATVTPTGRTTADFDLLLTTTGATTSPSDWVFFFLAVGPTSQYVPQGPCDYVFDFFDYYGSADIDTYYALRGSGGNQFSASFSFTGLSVAGYKWSAWAFYYYGDMDNPVTTPTLTQVYSFFYSTVCPWLNNPTVNAGSILFTISDTDSASPNSDTGVWRQGIIIGSQAGTGKPIPTLGTWGLLVLGVMMAGAGLFVLRRV
jgi:hypothetical protein